MGIPELELELELEPELELGPELELNFYNRGRPSPTVSSSRSAATVLKPIPILTPMLIPKITLKLTLRLTLTHILVREKQTCFNHLSELSNKCTSAHLST